MPKHLAIRWTKYETKGFVTSDSSFLSFLLQFSFMKQVHLLTQNLGALVYVSICICLEHV